MAPDQAGHRIGTDTGTQPLAAGPRTEVAPPGMPVPAGPPASPIYPPPAGPPAPAARPVALMTRRRGAVLVACALVGVAVGVGAQHLVGSGGGEAAARTTPTPSAAPTPVSADVSSFALPGTGTGFPRNSGGVWSSQSYATEKFGNLKPGIGLLLDVGTARSLRAVTFDARTGPLTVQLRAADTKASDLDSYQPVGSPVQAKGATTLPATAGGSHRYWLLWVTQLGASDGGKFQAQLASVTAQG